MLKIPRIPSTLSVDSSGKITWIPAYIDYDSTVFNEGRIVTNTEFNRLFLQSATQTNYLSDSLDNFFKSFDNTLDVKLKNLYDLTQSYFKPFTEATWGDKQEDGYYYITIPASEHGYSRAQEGINIDIEMYLLNTDGKYYEVQQLVIAQDNTVTLYNDEPVLGFVVVRTNSRALEYLSTQSVLANNVIGLHPVAVSGDYTTLSNRPDATIEKNKQDILELLIGTKSVINAQVSQVSESLESVEDNDRIILKLTTGELHFVY